MSDGAPVRASITFIPSAMSAVEYLRGRTGLNQTDVANRAVLLYRLVQEQIDAGSYPAFVRPDGTVERLHLL